MRLVPESWIVWWRLRGRRCPACGSVYSRRNSCRVCYGWAAKFDNQGKIPAADLVENWRKRHADSKKSTPV